MLRSTPFIVCAFLFITGIAVGQESKIIYLENGRLTYVSDSEGNRIPDFSYAGYKGGGVPLPEVSVKLTLSALSGDNTAHIQRAIDSVSALSPTREGLRGAILLEPGEYDVYGTLYLRTGGVVLRGSGDGKDPSKNTVLIARGNRPAKRSVIIIGGRARNDWADEIPGTRAEIITPFVPVGSRSFEVNNASAFSVGDNIIIRHPSTKAWLQKVDMGGTDKDEPWKEGALDIVYNRNITAIKDHILTVDAPVFSHLDRSLAPCTVYKYDREKIISLVGVEDFRIDIETPGPKSEDHARNAVVFDKVENAWARGVTALHFTQSGFVTLTATFVTITHCRALDPHSIITGGRRYNFNAGGASNNILFDHCYASQGRHDFVSNGASKASGIVFYQCISDSTHDTSEGHRRWTQGLLYDNVTFLHPQSGHPVLGLYNRGSYGTGHGWAAVHSVAWNVKTNGRKIIIQKPPFAQNYSIGSEGIVSGKGPFEQPAGYIQGREPQLSVTSLYKKQLSERLTYGLPPDAPALVTARKGEIGTEISWIHPGDSVIYYSLERSVNGGKTFVAVGKVPASHTSFTDTPPGREQIVYRVRALGPYGYSAYGNTTSLNPGD